MQSIIVVSGTVGWIGMTLWKNLDLLDETVLAIQNDDPDWEYILGTDAITGYFCILVFDEDGYLVGTL